MGLMASPQIAGFYLCFKELAQAVSVPVVSSALMQVRQVNALLPDDRRTGIHHFSVHFDKSPSGQSRCPPDTLIGTTEHGKEFTSDPGMKQNLMSMRLSG